MSWKSHLGHDAVPCGCWICIGEGRQREAGEDAPFCGDMHDSRHCFLGVRSQSCGCISGASTQTQDFLLCPQTWLSPHRPPACSPPLATSPPLVRKDTEHFNLCPSIFM